MFDFKIPKIEIAEMSEDKKYGRFVVEPLERGYGTTLGNSLRRIMLSSLPGAAVSQVKIEGVLHEFSPIPGVKEDVAEIIMNIKKLAIKNNSETNEPKIAYTECDGREGVVRASDIQVDSDIEILNPDLKIATLNGGPDCKLLDSELESVLTEYATLYYSDETLATQETNLDTGMSEPKEILEYLSEKCTSEFPEPYTKDFVVEYQSKATEVEGTVAYYLSARLDQLDYNSIKVNGSAVEGDDVQLYTTLAHEGFPGHLYQYTSVYNNEEIPNVLKLVDFIGFTEGYAQYASDRSYRMLGCSEELSQMCAIDEMFGYILQSRVDLGVNYEGWGVDDVSGYLNDYINDEDGSTAQSIYETVISDPGLLLPYTVGHIKMIKLREKAERKLGDSFDAKEFHQLILDTGIVPFEIMEEELNNYIAGKKGR